MKTKTFVTKEKLKKFHSFKKPIVFFKNLKKKYNKQLFLFLFDYVLERKRF